MAYESIVKIYKGVPLQPNSGHTVWFGSNGSVPDTNENRIKLRQKNWFEQYKFQEFNEMSYQRVSDGVVEVAVNADLIYDANYISVSNSADGHVYYGFILKVEYINERNSKVTYQLDGLQTFQEGIVFKECFVERAHQRNDAFGANTVPEGIDYGRYVYGNSQRCSEIPIYNPTRTGDTDIDISFGQWRVVMLTALKNATISNGKPQPIATNVFGSLNEMKDYIDNRIENLEDIVCMYMCPAYWQTTDPLVQYKERGGHADQPLTIDGYAPNNMKVLQYPYCYIQVSNYQGNTLTYKWEDCDTDGGKRVFRYYISGCGAPGSKFAFYPEMPMPIGTGQMSFAPLMSDILPNIPIPGDAFRAWYAQNANSLEVANMAVGANMLQNGIGMIGNAGGMLSSALTGGVAGGGGISWGNLASTVVSGYMGAKSNSAKIDDAKAMPDYVKGSVSSDTQFSKGNYGFEIIFTQITREYAERIDNFFDRYGYQQNAVYAVNPGRRKRYFYFKTSENPVQIRDQSNVWGIPSFVYEDWKRNCMNGITLWHYDQIGTKANSTMFDYSDNKGVHP